MGLSGKRMQRVEHACWSYHHECCMFRDMLKHWLQISNNWHIFFLLSLCLFPSELIASLGLSQASTEVLCSTTQCLLRHWLAADPREVASVEAVNIYHIICVHFPDHYSFCCFHLNS